jgi:hypothetical protein
MEVDKHLVLIFQIHLIHPSEVVEEEIQLNKNPSSNHRKVHRVEGEEDGHKDYYCYYYYY